MSITAGKKANKTHPKYDEYAKKVDAIAQKRFAAEEKIRAKYPDYKGYGHPEGDKLREIKDLFCKELEELKVAYRFLFEEIN